MERALFDHFSAVFGTTASGQTTLNSSPADFKPITMIHSFAKLISKILALRLAPKLNALVDTNQNTFIRSRTT
jgi:hypothetical protein